MPKIRHICIIPGETGVCATVEDTNGSNVQHYRGNLNDALDLVHELLRPVTTDDGAPYVHGQNS
jgi:hypothetical protein